MGDSYCYRREGWREISRGGCRSDALLSVEKAVFGLAGYLAAPRLWMIIDPYCSYSVRAFDALKPYVTAGSIQLAVVPISILDYEDNGQSTPAAQSLLSQNPTQMVEAWDHQNFPARRLPRAHWCSSRRTIGLPRKSVCMECLTPDGARRMERG